MPDTLTIRRHAALVDTMANAQNIDLEEQILRGALSVPELDDAVLRCTGCAQACSCERWLADLAGPVEAAPGYCRNTELFASLKQG